MDNEVIVPDAESDTTVSLHRLVRAAADRLVEAGIPPEEARLDAELFARQALGWDRASFIVHERDATPPGFATRFEPLVARRVRREPVAHVLGRSEFWGLELEITPDVLIPRPETELIVEEALVRFTPPSQPSLVADVGTGSGCLAIALALAFPSARVVATDVSDRAIEVARRNARRHAVDERIAFHVGALLHTVEAPDLVVSNPPYVPERDRATLQPEVRDFEPAEALFGGEDGFDVIRALVHDARARVRRDAWLVFEFGFGQEHEVRALLEGDREPDGRVAWAEVAVRHDLQGIPRVVAARRA